MIYFLCHEDEKNYQWDIVPIGEGLEEKGVPFCSSANYWRKPDGSFLFKKNQSIDPLKARAIIVSTGYLHWIKDSGQVAYGNLPDWLVTKKPNEKPRVIGMDASDGYINPITSRWIDCFDLVLRSHFNNKLWWPSNVKPWVFGLTKRIIDSAANSKKTWSERNGCLFTFGASHGYTHPARKWATEKLLPILSEMLPINESTDNLSQEPLDPSESLLWKQCARRHSAAYFARMGAAKACAAFCGDLIPAYPKYADYLVGGKKAKLKRFLWNSLSKCLHKNPRNVQPDSWRFWEGLASETAVIHFDAIQAGWEMPVMPENWKHYIGVNLENADEAVVRLKADPDLLRRVAEEGRKWALANYSPSVTAERLLSYLKN